MTAPLSLPQRMGLIKYMETALEKLRKGDVAAQAAREMPSGSRLPVMFGGELAGFALMPEPSKRQPYVSDEAKLLAWARRHYPEKVEPTVEVVVDDDLIAYLADHYPQALKHGERVQPAWVSDLCDSLRGGGRYVTKAGDIIAEVPGITVPEPSPPSARVDLDNEKAGAIIGRAWRGGLIPAEELLALPAPDVEPPL